MSPNQFAPHASSDGACDFAIKITTRATADTSSATLGSALLSIISTTRLTEQCHAQNAKASIEPCDGPRFVKPQAVGWRFFSITAPLNV
jgi:hypothetical protein